MFSALSILPLFRSCDKTTLETDRYPHVVRACNEYLAKLQNIHGPGTRSARRLNILFERNDPRTHGSANANVRKPDIIITTLRAAQRTANVESDWSHFVKNIAPNQPTNSTIGWLDVLACMELERVHDELNYRVPKPTHTDPRPHKLHKHAFASESAQASANSAKRRTVDLSCKCSATCNAVHGTRLAHACVLGWKHGVSVSP